MCKIACNINNLAEFIKSLLHFPIKRVNANHATKPILPFEFTSDFCRFMGAEIFIIDCIVLCVVIFYNSGDHMGTKWVHNFTP